MRYEWALRLEPMQRRMIMHECVENRVVPETISRTGMLFFDWTNLRDVSMTTRLPYLLNYAPGERDKRWVEETRAKSRVDAEGYFKDELGFKWRHGITVADGMTAELGADRVLQLWLDGFPATFVQPASTKAADGTQVMTAGMTCYPVTGPVTVTREKVWIQKDGAFFMDDLVVNTGQEPAKTRVEFAIVASNRFTGLLAADGSPLDITQPVPVSRCEGKIAILGEGADKPVILVGVGDGNAVAPPATVRWVNGRVVYVTYDFDLNPGQQVPLLHFATQRPLGAYDTLAEGMAQLDVARLLDLHSKLKLAQPVNWSVKVP